MKTTIRRIGTVTIKELERTRIRMKNSNPMFPGLKIRLGVSDITAGAENLDGPLAWYFIAWKDPQKIDATATKMLGQY